jgi:hypothetical protein
VFVATPLVWSFAACGTTVDLGGTADGGAADAGGIDILDLCEPCADAPSCPLGTTCAQIAGTHLFCATLCPRGTECDVDDTCELVATSVPGETMRTCVPKGRQCDPPPPPTSDGSQIVDHCGALDGPTVAAACRSCDKFDRDCQKNGCYGGWWCNTKTSKCQRPPASCP